MAAQTASQNIPKPERPDAFNLTADTGAALDKIDMLFAQTRGEAAAAGIIAEEAKAASATALSRADSIESPFHAGPDKPEGSEWLWADTDSDEVVLTTVWGEVGDKPTAFPPEDHGHEINDVAGLQAALDGAGGGGVSSWNELTDKPATFPPSTHSHAWGQVTGKPTTFPPSAHAHTVANVTGLQADLDGKADAEHLHQMSEVEGLESALSSIGEGGGTVEWSGVLGKPATFPPSSHDHGISDVTGLQSALNEAGADPAWSDITGKPATFAPESHSHSWAQVTGKPTTFAPSAHEHTQAQVTGLSAALTSAAASAAWASITGKPTTFAPATHAHAWADITGKPTTFAPSAHAHSWAQVTDKPTAFTPTSHQHGISEVTGLQEALDAGLSGGSGGIALQPHASIDGIFRIISSEVAPDLIAVTATAPTFDDDQNTYTIPSTPGVTYRIGGYGYAAGTYPVAIGDSSLTITATPWSGYQIDGTSTWTFQYTEASRGEGMVGELAASSPYTELRVTGVDDEGAVESFDITAQGGGRSITTRVQGPFVAGTPYIDGYQRMEEITTGDGYLMGPRSNLEWATQLYASTTATSGSQFSPYHGSTTALAWQASAPIYRTLSGDPVVMPGPGASRSMPDGLEIVQTVEAKHPGYTGSGNQLSVTTTTSFHPDGMVEVQGTWKALTGIKVSSVYAPMTPFQRDDITSLEYAGGTVAIDNSAPSGTTNQSLPSDVTSGVFRSASRPNMRIAWAFTNPDETLRLGEADRKTVGDILFIQRRTDGINKLYRYVWNPNTVVAAGTEYNFGAQWRYMEVA